MVKLSRQSSLSDNQKLLNLLNHIDNEKGLSETVEKFILKTYPKIGKSAIKLLREKKLHKIIVEKDLELWEVEGRSKSYLLIEDNFCECTDFQIRVLKRREKLLCYHLLTKIIGKKLRIYNIKRISNEDYAKLINSKIEK